MTDGPFISSSELFDHTRFELLQDYWVHFHHPHLRYFWWLKNYMLKVERFIRKNWLKCLPKREIVLRKIELKDEDFNLIKFKQDSEGYIEKLLAWKLKNERYHLSRNSFKQIRHKKCMELRSL